MALPCVVRLQDYNATGVLWLTAAISRNFFLYLLIRDFPRKRTSKEQYPSKNIKYLSNGLFGKGLSGETKMKESQLIQNIRKYLATLPECFFWKEHGGQYGTAGIPDIIVCYKGRFIALEAKVGRNQPTRLQAATIDQIRRAGGTACVVRSVDEVKEIMNNA